ncbi:fibronectin type iii domain-containing 3ba-related [Anaeramoeba ignava]|uniref:Fibronectin type iii domain-containing 3ba-related n=1 Tax=Anaeramoeba ignava TaxID=1746090 RepID=A0A9Q0RC83_ANAIG|nr:fibronectin type iii domain-containing 3ba-related [Anaeramoeba ignava]
MSRSTKDIYNEKDITKLPQWIQTQIRVFTRWCNLHLQKRNLQIEDARTDFASGVILINLMEILAIKKCPQRYSPRPRVYAQKLENCKIGIDFVDSERLPKEPRLVNVGGEDLIKENLKIILGLIWILIRRYQISQGDDSETNSTQKMMLEWILSRINDFGVQIRNLTDDLNDGIALCCLVEKQKPGNIQISQLSKDNAQENLGLAFDKANELMEIPKLLEPKDLLTDSIDALSVLTYLSYFRNYSLNNPDEIKREFEDKKPEKIEEIEVEPKLNEIELKWKEPKNEGSEIEKYEIEVNNEIIGESEKPKFIIENIKPSTNYSIRIRAKNSKGEAEWSNEIKTKTEDKEPEKIREIEVEPKLNEIELKWKEPKNEGSEIEKYEIEVNNEIIGESEKPKFIIENLKPSENYSIRIRAKNSKGEAEWSDEIKTKTDDKEPEKIREIEVEPKLNEIELKWKEPKNEGSEIEKYEIEVNNEIIGESEKPKFIIENIKPSTNYSIRIRAKNSKGEGEWSDEIKTKTKNKKPEKIREIEVEPKLNEIELKWKEPKNEGSEIEKYEIEVNNEIIGESEKPEFIIENIKPSENYSIRIRAKNSKGEAEWSDEIKTKTDDKEPEKIEEIEVEPKLNEIELKWKEPKNEGSEIEKYEIEVNNEIIAESEKPEFIIENIKPSTYYSIRIRAKNSKGEGEWSDEIKTKTKNKKPEKIREIEVEPKLNEIELKWKEPKNEGSEIEKYEIEVNNEIIGESEKPEFIIENLKPSTNYSIRIRAKNSKGESEWSDEIKTKTDDKEPEKIEEIEVEPKLNEIELKWKEPKNEGSEIEKYEIEVNNEIIGESEKPEFIIENIKPSTNYSIRIRAKNSKGEAEWSNEIKTKTEDKKPEKIEEIEVEPKLNEIELKWKEPKNEGSEIEKYEIEVNNEIIAESKKPKFIIENLKPSTNYSIRIRAKNSKGEAEWSDEIKTKTDDKEPEKIREIEVEPKLNEIELKWKEPKNEGSEIEKYEIEVNNEIIGESEKPEFIIENIKPSTNYSIRIRAKNSKGEAEWSDEIKTKTDDKKPEKIREIEVEPKLNEIELKWKEPKNEGSEIEKYEIEVNNEIIAESEKPEFIIENIKPSENYSIRIRAKNSKGEGEWSNEIKTKTDDKEPEKIEEIEVEPKLNEIELKWKEPKNEGSEIEKYEIEVNNEIIGESKKPKFIIENIKPSENYSIRIRAKNSKGEAEWSNEIKTKTEDKKPEKIEEIEVEPKLNEIELKWKEPKNEGSEIEKYEIEVNNEIIAESKKPKFIIENLKPSTNYSIRIRAKNSKGEAEWSDEIKTKTDDKEPEKIREIEVEPKLNEIELKWKEPKNEGSEIEKYEIEVNNEIIGESKKPKFIIENIKPSENYSIRIRAKNSKGEAEWSDEIKN